MAQPECPFGFLVCPSGVCRCGWQGRERKGEFEPQSPVAAAGSSRPSHVQAWPPTATVRPATHTPGLLGGARPIPEGFQTGGAWHP